MNDGVSVGLELVLEMDGMKAARSVVQGLNLLDERNFGAHTSKASSSDSIVPSKPGSYVLDSSRVVDKRNKERPSGFHRHEDNMKIWIKSGNDDGQKWQRESRMFFCDRRCPAATPWRSI
jgi:hypothetical protein